jgi:4a-hydroxytetrahydrobiopterin dehydratase
MRPKKLDTPAVGGWLSAHPGWERTGETALAKEYKTRDFASALALAVRIGCYAEKRDHHPDLEIGWGRLRVRWGTHDAGGVTQLDLEAAESTDAMAS